MTIINRIFNYRFILFSVYHLLSFRLIITTVVKLCYVSFIIKLLLDWIGLGDKLPGLEKT